MIFIAEYKTLFRAALSLLLITTLVNIVTALPAHAARAAGFASFMNAPLIQNDQKLSPAEKAEILWLARAVYSETKIKEEQLIVAWVIRNRVESEKFGDTYRDVVLQRSQFSGLNPSDSQYYRNVSRSWNSKGTAWESALAIAEAVYRAPETLRPISDTVTHFYSPISTNTTPHWAEGLTAVQTIKDPDTHAIRFAFYNGVK